MNGHVFDELPLLLSGEADRATVSAVAAHLRECDDCRDELISALTAHAALSSAARFAPELASLGDEFSASVATTPTPVARVPLPDLSAVFAQVRAEADAEADTPAALQPVTEIRRPGFGRYRLWVAAAAAVVVVALAGGGVYVAQRDNGSTAPTRSLSLSAFDQGTAAASARLIGTDQMTLDASALPALAPGNYYEVWLTNPQRTSMAPIGLLDAARKASFTVPANEMSTYAAIEVSVQQTSGVGSYSGHSVLRGEYA